MRISDWSSDVCSSDLAVILSTRRTDEGFEIIAAIDYDESLVREAAAQSGDSARLDIENARQVAPPTRPAPARSATPYLSDAIAKMSVRPAHVNNADAGDRVTADGGMRGNPYPGRSEEHTSELQSLMRISYAVFCLKKKKNTNNYTKIKIIKIK